MSRKKYTPKYFKESLPEWKRKKDPFLSRLFYRKVSFYVAAFCANKGINANTVSNFSTFLGIFASVLMLSSNRVLVIVGAILINVWLILDCTDGNLARAYKMQPYGEFVDALSSYISCAFLFNILGLQAYYHGMFFKGNVLICIMAAFASTFDTLMRLIYQKYIVISRELGVEGKVKQDGSNANKIDKLRMKIDQQFNLGGILPLVVLLAVIYEFTDIVVILWTIYFGTVFFATFIYLLLRVNKYVKQNEKQMKAQ